MNLSKDQILNLKPGRELDALVAENVMKWGADWFVDYMDRNHGKWWEPSTDISAAWEVVEKLGPTHCYNLCDFGRNKYPDKPHYARFAPINKGNTADDWLPRSETIPLAICRAALLSLIQEDTPS